MLELAQKLSHLFKAYGAPAPIHKMTLGPAEKKELQGYSNQISDIDWSSPNIPPQTSVELSELLARPSKALESTIQNIQKTIKIMEFALSILAMISKLKT